MSSKICAVIPAAGRGLRMGQKQPKQFLELQGRPILSHTLEVISRVPSLAHVFLVVPDDYLPQANELIKNIGEPQSENKLPLQYRLAADRPSGSMKSARQSRLPGKDGVRITAVAGGRERQDSIYNALRILPVDCDWVMIHDGVRPLVSLSLLRETVRTAQETGAAIAALPATDTIKRVCRQQVVETVPRDDIWLVQTPQVFRKDIIVQAYRRARANSWSGTDDAFFVEQLHIPVQVVQGERSNIKITTPEDLEWAAWFLSRKQRDDYLSR